MPEGAAHASTGGITASLVSHRQCADVELLLSDLFRVQPAALKHLILINNVPDRLPAGLDRAPFKITVIHNSRAKGLPANHNQALRLCDTPWFAALNPDLRCSEDFLAALVRGAQQDDGVLAPLILERDGRVADAGRRLITPAQIWRRVALGQREPAATDQVEWIAGMCLLVRTSALRELGGFDERYYLYCEDADLSLRMQISGWRVRQIAAARVTHIAQRESRRRLGYLRWHVMSLMRLWSSSAFWRYLRLRKQLDEKRRAGSGAP